MSERSGAAGAAAAAAGGKAAAASGGWVLRGSAISPYVRKVRIAAAALGLAERVAFEIADPNDPADALHRQNPLGKIPTLLLPDGSALYDSRVILEYLDSLASPTRLWPASGPARFRALTRAALAEGIIDAAYLTVSELRHHEPQQLSRSWLERQHRKLEHGLGSFAAEPPDPARSDAVSIGLACALGYLEFRKVWDWRAQLPGLAEWLERFAEQQPAFGATHPQ